jgi:Domain of unknown function (DUF4209)
LQKGFFFGFEFDFVSALYLLVPQVEHLVRWHLKKADVITTVLNTDGIENEIGLSALIEKPEVQTIFGDNLHFELKALFCSAYGFNLRNEVAHGLLNFERSASERSVVCWAFCFRIVMNYQKTQLTSASY